MIVVIVRHCIILVKLPGASTRATPTRTLTPPLHSRLRKNSWCSIQFEDVLFDSARRLFQPRGTFLCTIRLWFRIPRIGVTSFRPFFSFARARCSTVPIRVIF